MVFLYLSFTKCTVLNGDVAKWRIIMSWDCRPISIKMASMVIKLVLSMVKGSILEHVEVDFVLISRGKEVALK